jgi:hypothetical protein
MPRTTAPVPLRPFHKRFRAFPCIASLQAGDSSAVRGIASGPMRMPSFPNLRGVEPFSTGNRFLIYGMHPGQSISIWMADDRNRKENASWR